MLGLAGVGVGQGLLVRADADRAPAGGGGALGAQRALGAGRGEVGGAATGAGRADRGGDPAGQVTAPTSRSIPKRSLLNNPPAAVGAWVLQRSSIPAWPSRS